MEVRCMRGKGGWVYRAWRGLFVLRKSETYAWVDKTTSRNKPQSMRDRKTI